MEPYLGEIRLFSFAPATRTVTGWMLCDGRTLAINQWQALFALLGTAYGGDGKTNFKIPDLRSRVPMHRGVLDGTTYAQGTSGGAETVQLTATQLPSHSHDVKATQASSKQTYTASNALFGTVSSKKATPAKVYAPFSATTKVALHPLTVESAGNSTGHPNMQPYLAIGYFMCSAGLWPSRA